MLAEGLLDLSGVLCFGQGAGGLVQERDQACDIGPGGRSARGHEGRGKRACCPAEELQRGLGEGLGAPPGDPREHAEHFVAEDERNGHHSDRAGKDAGNRGAGKEERPNRVGQHVLGESKGSRRAQLLQERVRNSFLRVGRGSRLERQGGERCRSGRDAEAKGAEIEAERGPDRFDSVLQDRGLVRRRANGLLEP